MNKHGNSRDQNNDRCNINIFYRVCGSKSILIILLEHQNWAVEIKFCTISESCTILIFFL